MHWVEQFTKRHKLPAGYADNVLKCVVPLAEDLQGLCLSAKRPPIIGISGAQGSGKTTFTQFLARWLDCEMELSAVCLSLDDFYLSRSERKALALAVHSLFATRGVPGTHDVRRARQALDALTRADGSRKVVLPAFDKAGDDRAPEAVWRAVRGPFDLVLFEGWCLGARPQAAQSLAGPVNRLEEEEDRSATWRRHVNQCLAADYADLFARLDRLIMLRIPSFERVFEWRALQERRLREESPEAASGGTPPPGHPDAELVRFIEHYERLTRHMLGTMPGYADAVIDIDHNHRMTRIRRRARSAELQA